MANEAEIVDYFGGDGDVMNYTVLDANAITKGALVTMRGSTRTVSGSSAVTTGWAAGGIADSDKEAGDGSTSIGVITNCIATLTIAGGGETGTGQLIAISGANTIDGIKSAGTNLAIISGAVIGRALEPGAAGERVQCRVLL